MQLTSRVLLAVVAMVALIASLGSCGGSASISLDDQSAFNGITVGDFKAVRYNDAGYRDGSLNPTMDLSISEQGGLTTVTISVADDSPMQSVAIDLHYDPARYSPADVSFGSVIETPVQMAHTGIAGLVAVGQASTKGVALRSGRFATISFERQPFNGNRRVMAVHSDPLNGDYDGVAGWVVNPTAVDNSTDANWVLYGMFATGDGDQNGESNISDLTPIGVAFGNTPSSADLTGANADYDKNGEVNISDLTPLGAHFGQLTSGIDIMIGDAADATDTVLTNVAWSAGAAPNAGAPVTDAAFAWRTWTGAVTLADCQAADTNNDGTVFLSARATDGTTPGDAFDGTALTYPNNPQNFIINDIDVQFDGSDVNDGDDVTPAANATVTLDIVGVSGTYNGTPFTPGDAGGSVPQAEYDAALAAVIAQAVWTSTTGGDPAMRATAPVTSVSGTGPWTAVFFPDDDPESTGASAEGGLSVTVGPSGTFLPGALTVNLNVDVEADATAPLVQSIATNPDNGQDGNGDYLLSAVSNTTVTYAFDFGSGGAPGTIDGTTVEAELYCFESATAQALTYSATPPDAGGEFELFGAGPVLLNALISPSMVAPGLHYSIRIKDVGAGVFNSVNKPGQFLTVAPLPPAAELSFFPVSDPQGNPTVGSDTDQITIIWPEPVIRRNPNVTVQLDGTVLINEQNGFDDQIKGTGNEFPIAGVVGEGTFPQCTWIAGNDPSMIGANTPDDDVINQAVLYPAKQPDRIVCDIIALPNGTNLGDPDTPYAFKLFGTPVTPGDQGSRPAIGFGNFAIQAIGFGDAAIVPVDWGVNIFNGNGGLDRGTLEVADRDFSDKNPDSSTFGDLDAPGQPDVIFVEFNGGIVGDSSQPSNVQLIFKSQADDSEYNPGDFKVVCAGLGAGGLNYIGMHIFNTMDLLSEGLGGNLAGGGTYDLFLKDGNDANNTPVPNSMFIN